MKDILKLYLVTDRSLSLGRSLEEVVSEAVEGGVTIVQLREKDTPTGEFIQLAHRLKAILKPYGVPLIINDRVDVAIAVDAEGVHIGQSDMPYQTARKMLGPDKIIGLSVESMEDVLKANQLDVDYIGISPVFATPTKTDTATPFGLDGLREAVRLSVHPTVAIGGMNKSTAADVMQTGCDGIAVVSAISSAQSPKAAAEELKSIVIPDKGLRKLGEFGLIEQIRREMALPSGVVGIGDDCAVIPQQSGFETLVSTDMLIEGTHFLLEDISPYDLGWKSAAVNISDIAAMGGSCVGSFLSFALPSGLTAEWISEFIRGYKEISSLFDCPLLGGDTTSSPDRLCINVAVLGRTAVGGSVMRNGAVEGDLICVTGPLGDSGCGLKLILEGCGRDETVRRLIERHYRPVPCIREGRQLAEAGVSAMMDISDGIGSDLRHILKESGVGAEVDVCSIPLSEELSSICEKHGWDPLKLAISGGEDYQLLFTISEEKEKMLDVEHHIIGRITAENNLVWKGGNEDYSGYRHF